MSEQTKSELDAEAIETLLQRGEKERLRIIFTPVWISVEGRGMIGAGGGSNVALPERVSTLIEQIEQPGAAAFWHAPGFAYQLSVLNADGRLYEVTADFRKSSGSVFKVELIANPPKGHLYGKGLHKDAATAFAKAFKGAGIGV